MNKVEHDYEVIFVDVGQGDATLIRQLSNMNSVLIDAGVANPVLSILKRSAELEGIFITHWDKDHIGGMPAVISWLSNQYPKAVNIYINLQNGTTKIVKNLRRTLDEAYNNGTVSIKLACNDSKSPIDIIKGKFFILWPPYAKVITRPDDRNFGSVILRFEVGKFSLLMGGDAKGDVWRRIDQADLKAIVLRYPHHGGKLYRKKNDWSADNLISNVEPDWIVVSVGKKQQFGHPSKEFMDAKAKHPEIKFFSTAEGNINLQIESSAGNIRMETGYGPNSV